MSADCYVIGVGVKQIGAYPVKFVVDGANIKNILTAA
jgi:hypothetical protein